MSEGHPIRILDIDRAEIADHARVIDSIFATERSGVVVRNALPDALVDVAVRRLEGGLPEPWSSPNTGMAGGEIRVIGDAATPTFTALRGPSTERYAESARKHARRTDAIFAGADATAELAGVFSALFGGRPAAAPNFDGALDWAPYNYRALDPGVQIYSHHDNHYGLAVYANMPADLDRSTLLSWFVTLQPADAAGQLIVYGLWGSDPNPPMLPTRFLDTAALERRFEKHVFDLRAGDLVIFDSGRHVHRVSPVEGERPRLTLGGFLTVDTARTRLAFWS